MGETKEILGVMAPGEPCPLLCGEKRSLHARRIKRGAERSLTLSLPIPLPPAIPHFFHLSPLCNF